MVLLLSSCTTAYLAKHARLAGDEWQVRGGAKPGSGLVASTWADVSEDTIHLFRAGAAPYSELPPLATAALAPVTLYKRSLDLDVLTIPVKFRPGLLGVPPILSAYFSGAIYLGYRFDRQRITYKPAWQGRYKRMLNPFAISFGAMAGFSQARIDNASTRNRAISEYEGVAVMQGLAVIVSVSRVNFGASLGFDYLLDENRRIWAHQMQPWVGLVIGLNLN